MDINEVTTGELYRRLCDMDERHGATLADISTQVRLTNGRTTRLEAHVEGHDRELRDLKREREAAQAIPSELKELIDLARDARGVARFGRVMWAIGGALVPLIVWLAAHWKG
jgi:hypothetical protein